MGVSGGPKVSKLSNTILILGALFLVLMSRYIDAQTAKADLVGGERLTTFLQLLASARTVEQSFAVEAEVTREELPIQLDEDTVFQSIAADGRRLRMVFTIPDDITSLEAGIENWLAQDYCPNERFGIELRKGGVIILSYQHANGTVVQEYEITVDNCSA